MCGVVFPVVFHIAADWSVALFPLHFMSLITQVKMNLDICSPHHSEIRTRHWHVQRGWIPNALFWVKEAWLKILHSLLSFIWHLRNIETTGTRLQGARGQDMKDFQRWYKCSVLSFVVIVLLPCTFQYSELCTENEDLYCTQLMTEQMEQCVYIPPHISF